MDEEKRDNGFFFLCHVVCLQMKISYQLTSVWLILLEIDMLRYTKETNLRVLYDEFPLMDNYLMCLLREQITRKYFVDVNVNCCYVLHLRK